MQQNEIFVQLQNVSYSKAIDRYNYLKQRFFFEYGATADMEEERLIDYVENEIVNDINNNPIEGQQAIVEDLLQTVATTMADRLKGVKNRKDIKKLYQQSKRQGLIAANQLGESLLSEQELADFIKTRLASMGVGTGFSIEDILNQVRSYRNKIILTQTNTSAKSYIRSTKGYYREALVYKAFAKLTDYIDTMPVLSTGATKNKKGQDTLYDTYISFLKNVEGDFQALVNEQVDVGYGIQSKSWSAPWETETIGYFNAKYGFSVGNRADLLAGSGLNNTLSNLYTWTKGVLYLEQMAVQAIGENQLGFVTGKNFYWTADLIANFRAMNYFLAFGYREAKSLSPSVNWQLVPQHKI